MKLEINWDDGLKKENSVLYKGEVWDYFDEGLSRRVYVNSDRTKVVKFLIEPMGVDFNEIENRIYQTAASNGELAHTQLVDGVIEQEFLEPIKGETFEDILNFKDKFLESNDEDFTVRNSLESWMNAINSHAGNLRNNQAGSPSGYTVDATVTQFGKTGDTLKSYKFVGMFPVDVAPIDLDWGSNDVIEEYAVTFAYQWWEADQTTS